MKATLSLLWAFAAVPKCAAFVVRPIRAPSSSQGADRVIVSVLASTLSPQDDDEEREYARVRRRGGKRERDQDDYFDNQENSAYEEDDRSRRRRPKEVYDNNEDWIDYDRLDDLLDDDDDDDDDDYIKDEEEYDLLSNVLIPNPLLDSIDPDGAAERFPELASDPRFWLDMVLFISFLNFLSFMGPQDPYPTVPWY